MPNLKLGNGDYLWAAGFNGTDDLIRMASFIKRAGEAGVGETGWVGERGKAGGGGGGGYEKGLPVSAMGQMMGVFALWLGRVAGKDCDLRRCGPVRMNTYLLHLSFIHTIAMAEVL